MKTTLSFLLGLAATLAEPDFEREVRPFLKQHCYKCHDARKANAGFRVDELGTDFLSRKTADHWHEVINQINSGEMPPCVTRIRAGADALLARANDTPAHVSRPLAPCAAGLAACQPSAGPREFTLAPCKPPLGPVRADRCPVSADPWACVSRGLDACEMTLGACQSSLGECQEWLGMSDLCQDRRNPVKTRGGRFASLRR